jgi:hypothetical protein
VDGDKAVIMASFNERGTIPTPDARLGLAIFLIPKLGGTAFHRALGHRTDGGGIGIRSLWMAWHTAAAN